MASTKKFFRYRHGWIKLPNPVSVESARKPRKTKLDRTGPMRPPKNQAVSKDAIKSAGGDTQKLKRKSRGQHAQAERVTKMRRKGKSWTDVKEATGVKGPATGRKMIQETEQRLGHATAPKAAKKTKPDVKSTDESKRLKGRARVRENPNMVEGAFTEVQMGREQHGVRIEAVTPHHVEVSAFHGQAGGPTHFKVPIEDAKFTKAGRLRIPENVLGHHPQRTEGGIPRVESAQKTDGPKPKLTNVERGGARTAYAANIEVDGQNVGYVQKVQGGESYKAYADGVQIGRSRKLNEVKEEIAEHFANKTTPMSSGVVSNDVDSRWARLSREGQDVFQSHLDNALERGLPEEAAREDAIQRAEADQKMGHLNQDQSGASGDVPNIRSSDQSDDPVDAAYHRWQDAEAAVGAKEATPGTDAGVNQMYKKAARLKREYEQLKNPPKYKPGDEVRHVDDLEFAMGTVKDYNPETNEYTVFWSDTKTENQVPPGFMIPESEAKEPVGTIPQKKFEKAIDELEVLASEELEKPLEKIRANKELTRTEAQHMARYLKEEQQWGGLMTAGAKQESGFHPSTARGIETSAKKLQQRLEEMVKLGGGKKARLEKPPPDPNKPKLIGKATDPIGAEVHIGGRKVGRLRKGSSGVDPAYRPSHKTLGSRGKMGFYIKYRSTSGQMVEQFWSTKARALEELVKAVETGKVA